MDPRGKRRIDTDHILAAVEARAGTYALLFESDSEDKIRVGRLGALELASGVYVYVGSALGSGGVRARVRRHLGSVDRKHWHVDYLRAARRISGFFLAYSRRRLEHAWASALLRLSEGVPPLAGFGASDCRCQSHLVFFPGWPDRAQFREALRGASPRNTEIHEFLIH